MNAEIQDAVGGNLLVRRPEEVIWDPGFKMNVHTRTDEKHFVVRTKGSAVFSMRQTASNHFTLRVRFVPEFANEFGIVWGHGKKEVPGKASVDKAHAVIVTVRGEEAQLSVVEFTLPEWTRKSIGSISLLTPLKHTFQPATEVDLELEVKGGAIKRLRVQDTELHDIPTPRPVFQQGGLGLYFSGGYVVVTEAWYHDKEK
jgi:hypothetical protein